jgi:hypothetical protein
MAGTLVVTTSQVASGVSKYSCAWTSTAGGAVSGNPFDVVRGCILQVKFIPGTGGNQPTNNYTVALNDTDGVDVFAGIGQGTNLSNASSKIAVPYFGLAATQVFSLYFHDGSEQLDLVVAGAGSVKQGTVIFWSRVGTE